MQSCAPIFQARMYFSQYRACLISGARVIGRCGHTALSHTECSQVAGLNPKGCMVEAPQKHHLFMQLTSYACTIPEL